MSWNGASSDFLAGWQAFRGASMGTDSHHCMMYGEGGSSASYVDSESDSMYIPRVIA